MYILLRYIGVLEFSSKWPKKWQHKVSYDSNRYNNQYRLEMGNYRFSNRVDVFFCALQNRVYLVDLL